MVEIRNTIFLVEAGHPPVGNCTQRTSARGEYTEWWSFFVLSYASKSGGGCAPLSDPACCAVTQTMIRACASSKSGVSSTIVVAQPSTRSIKPISTVLLYQSASLLPFCRNEQEFYREFLLARLKNFVPALPGGKSFHFFFFKGNLIDTLDVCCFYALWNWDLFSPLSSSSSFSWSAKSSRLGQIVGCE